MSNLVTCTNCQKEIDIPSGLIKEQFIGCPHCEQDIINPLLALGANKLSRGSKLNSILLLGVFALLIAFILGYYFNDSVRKESRGGNNSNYTLIKKTKKTYSGVRLLKRKFLYDSRSGTYSGYCEVANNTGGGIGYIELQAVFYDKRNNILGIALGNTVNIPNGYTKLIYFDAINVSNPDSYDVEITNALFDLKSMQQDEAYHKLH